MGTIRIEIMRTTDSNSVQMYVSFPHSIGTREAWKFRRAFSDAIELAERWRRDEVLEIAIKPAAKDLNKAKGGRARAASLSAERRSEIAREAAKSRWGKENAN